MHEYGIVRNLLSAVDEHVRAQAGRRPARAVRVVLSVTGVTGPDEHVLRDAFDAFKAGTSADQAELVLERAPLEICCLACGRLAIPANGRCPLCGSDTILPAKVQDICLKSVEIEV
ncbi:MAG TPA: hydrogenase maturation nickel metallochaperone HypA [Streptosporangiaceae bacterium]